MFLEVFLIKTGRLGQRLCIFMEQNAEAGLNSYKSLKVWDKE